MDHSSHNMSSTGAPVQKDECLAIPENYAFWNYSARQSGGLPANATWETGLVEGAGDKSTVGHPVSNGLLTGKRFAFWAIGLGCALGAIAYLAWRAAL